MAGSLRISIPTAALTNCAPVPCCSNLEVKKAAIKFSKRSEKPRKKWGYELPGFLITELLLNTKATEANRARGRKVNGTEQRR